MISLAVRNLDRSSSWSGISSWTKDFNQIFGEMNKMLVPFRIITGESENGLACDIHETKSNYLMSLDIPGVSKEDISIECSGNHVTVSAERRHEDILKNMTTHRVERSYGLLQRNFVLPKGVDQGGIQASFENGVLYLSAPKHKSMKPKKIAIKSGEGEFVQQFKRKTCTNKVKVANT